MSLDVCLTRRRWISYDAGKTYTEENEEVFSANITNNLNKMANAAGIYDALWRPYRFADTYQIESESDDSFENLSKNI